MKKSLVFISLIAAGLLLVLISVMLGTSVLAPADVWAAFAGSGDSVMREVILSLRLPRIAVSLTAGAALSMSGCAFQAILRNPLADPYIIGVSGGAALGATLGIVFSIGGAGISLLAFAGSIAVISAVGLLARRYSYASTSLILAGVSVSFVLNAVIMLIFSFARSTEIHRAMMWLMGDLSMARYGLLLPASLLVFVLFIFLLFNHRQCDIISIGEDFSFSQGISSGSVRNIFLAASLLAAVSVALAGVIGFVGLVVPHLFRRIFGPNHIRLIPLSALGGGVFLMCCDAAGRTLIPPYEIPVGVITGLIGGLFFLFYLVTHRGTV